MTVDLAVAVEESLKTPAFDLKMLGPAFGPVLFILTSGKHILSGKTDKMCFLFLRSKMLLNQQIYLIVKILTS